MQSCNGRQSYWELQRWGNRFCHDSSDRNADISWWSVEDGAITGKITKEKPCRKNQYLFSDVGKMNDFELKLVALQLHSGPPMAVQFKDIRWKPLDAEEKKQP